MFLGCLVLIDATFNLKSATMESTAMAIRTLQLCKNRIFLLFPSLLQFIHFLDPHAFVDISFSCLAFKTKLIS